MTITYFNDINVYFHMKNHYKILRNVKSVVDTSIPESLVKCPMAMNNLDKRAKAATNEHLRQIYNTKSQGHPLKRKGPIKKHNCLSSEAKSEASLCFPSRPSTRRNSNATPQNPRLDCQKLLSTSFSKSDKMFKFHQRKKQSVASLRSNNSDVPNSSMQLDLLQESVNGSDPETPVNSKRSTLSKESAVPSSEHSHREQKNSIFSECSEEHEYLLFLLRITEDIISNDFYSNHDINKIFKTHMELNRDRLNKKKMHLHIANLCKELNIDCKEYQSLENADETDSPMKFQNSPIRHRIILNNEAFKSCQDCSVIRTSPLHQLHDCNPIGDNSMIMENIGDGPSISPSLLRLLDKLSLGRVTECTEPVASISTMNNSPRPNFPNGFENDEINFQEEENSPVDFETFIKELNSKEIVLNEPVEIKEDSLDAESIPIEIIPIKENPQNCTETSKNYSTYIQNLNDSTSNLETLKVPTEGSASNIELSEKENIDSEKYDSEFEKSSANNSISVEKHREQAQVETPKVDLNESQDKTVKISRIPVPIKESKASSENLYLEGEMDIISSKSSVTCNVSEIHQSPKSELNKDHEQKPQKQNEETDQQINSVHPKSPLKVILQGTVSDDDYVMIQGPVYVYKPLLESEPKLIVFSTNVNHESFRRDSLDSQHSHRTFTVEHTDVLDQAVQYEASLHSLEIDRSMENIMELTKTAYSQFRDLKLLQSDYDLTPEKESSENKYHHLMVDATTSISGVNLAERLLLSDDYVVNNSLKKNSDESNLEIAHGSQHEIDDYLMFEPKMYENNYVIHRKLISSVSMPKLKLKSGNRCDRNYGRNLQDLRYEPVLKKCSSDLISFDVTSQDSSLRSEGEAVHKSDYSQNSIYGNIYRH